MRKCTVFIIITLVVCVIISPMQYSKRNDSTDMAHITSTYYENMPQLATTENPEETSLTVSGILPFSIFDKPISENAVGVLEVRNKRFEVMDNVKESTLKDNLGLLTDSAIPPQIGNCIVMGHRNKQLRILEKANINDEIYFTPRNGIQYTFVVNDITIFESDNALRFDKAEQSTLVLVTCYPFYYNGHAPKKYVVSAVLV